jgi:hypothetical protein
MKAEEKKIFENVKNELAKKEGYDTWTEMYYQLNGTSSMLMYEKLAIEYANQLNELNEQVIENLINKLKKVNPNEFSIDSEKNKASDFKRSDLEALIFINIPNKTNSNEHAELISKKVADDILEQFELIYKPQN